MLPSRPQGCRRAQLWTPFLLISALLCCAACRVQPEAEAQTPLPRWSPPTLIPYDRPLRDHCTTWHEDTLHGVSLVYADSAGLGGLLAFRGNKPLRFVAEPLENVNHRNTHMRCWVDATDTFHVLWTRRNHEKDIDRLYSRSFDGQQWSPREIVYQYKGDTRSQLNWSSYTTSMLQEAHGYALISFDTFGNTMLLRQQPGGWQLEDMGKSFLYASLVRAPNDRLCMGFIEAAKTPERDTNSVHFMCSDDNGRTWPDDPILVHRSYDAPAYELYMATDASGRFHMLWEKRYEATEEKHRQFRHAYSDDGENWTESPPVPVPEKIWKTLSAKLIATPAGQLHYFVESFLTSKDHSEPAFNIHHMVWHPGQAWSPPEPLGHRTNVSDPAPLLDPHGRIHLVWTQDWWHGYGPATVGWDTLGTGTFYSTLETRHAR